MGLEVATYIASLVSSNPVGGTDQKAQGDDHLRLIKAVLQATFPNASKAFYFPQILTKTGAYSVVVGDGSALILADATSGAFAVSLPVVATLTAGWQVTVIKTDSGSNAVTVDTPGAETINGAASRSLALQYQAETYVFDGTNWKVSSTAVLDASESGAGKAEIATQAEVTAETDDARYITALKLARSAASAGHALINGKITFSVAASALTIAVKTLSGADPSATNPVHVIVPDGSGGINRRSITAATSLVISSGSTLGTSNSTPFRLWVGLLDNAGTMELFVYRSVSGNSIQFPFKTITTTAEGGAGAADSSQVAYSTTARTTKYFAWAVYADWESGLATAGTWSAGPTDSIPVTPATPRPGTRIGYARTDKTDTFTGSTGAIAAWVTVTGLSVALTVVSPCSIVRGRASICMGEGGSSQRKAARVTRSSSAVAPIGDAASSRTRVGVEVGNNNETYVLEPLFSDQPGTAATHTYQAEITLNSNASVYVNRGSTDTDSSSFFRSASYIEAEEVMV